jgi:anti-anti-sigma factor
MKTTVKVIRPSGILDGTQASQFRREINESLAKNTKIILIDFQDVTFMDSSGLGVLVLALKNARTAGCELFLCSINEQIKMLFELTSMDQVFKIYASREEFELTVSG